MLVALYYVVPGIGVGIYASLLATGVFSALRSVVRLLRRKTVGRVALYFSFMSIGALLVSLVPGDEHFLLAKGAVLTTATAGLFLLSLRASRPLVYSLTRPLLEGRLNWPSGWEERYSQSSRFQRMWKVATVLWAVGLLGDASFRVVMAYTFPPDLVPGLASALYVVTLVVLNVVLNVVVNGYYVLCGVFNRDSLLYQRDLPGS